MRVALVHDWLTGMRGGEKVLEVMCELWPAADLYTLLYVPGQLSPAIERMNIRTSFIQHMPRAARWYRNYLPLMPTAIEQFDLREYDLVISSSHCVAKGVITQPRTCHISYIHTPMRYVWELFEEYFGPQRAGRVKRAIIGVFANYLRLWDVASAQRVDSFVANSRHVARRIAKHYHREAQVIYPPVDTARFSPGEAGDYYLVVSALAPYKRIDLAIAACAKMGRRLVVAGSGQDAERLKKAAGPQVEFLGWQSDEQLAGLYRHCRAFLFPGEEDFGITPVEAQASGRPVIAFGKGGALETVCGLDQESPTGVFFGEQTVDSLTAAIREFEERESSFSPDRIREHALRFDREVFRRELQEYVARVYAEYQIDRGARG